VDDKTFNQTIANEWIRIIEDTSSSVREKDIYPLIRELLDQSSGITVLDIGCGQGVCSAHLGDLQVKYDGVDPSDDLTLRANDLYANAGRTFITGNIYALPFQDHHFDAVFSIAVWHLLSDIAKASQELNRVLKNKGKFLIVTADPNQYPVWTDRYVEKNFNGSIFTGTNFIPDGTAAKDTLYLYKMEEIVTCLQSAGLTIMKSQVVRSFVAISGYKD